MIIEIGFCICDCGINDASQITGQHAVTITMVGWPGEGRCSGLTLINR